jgi:hypothetical protein
MALIQVEKHVLTRAGEAPEGVDVHLSESSDGRFGVVVSVWKEGTRVHLFLDPATEADGFALAVVKLAHEALARQRLRLSAPPQGPNGTNGIALT